MKSSSRQRYIKTLTAAVVLAAMPVFAHCADAVQIVDLRAILRDARQFNAPDAVKDEKFVPIGGIEQWISVRGRHRDAPILLFLHGGPGFTSIPNSYLYTAEWQEYFTVVQWDQRGAGKTFGRNPGLQPTSLSIVRAVQDAEEVAAYIRKEYGRRKIVLMGHSWGSILGMKLAQMHPDWFYAYVGVGQATDARASEEMGYRATLAAAVAANDLEAIRDLKEIAPYPNPTDPAADLAHLGRERKWLAKYGGAVWRNTEAAVDAAGTISPDYSAEDWKNRDRGLDLNLAGLWGDITKVNLFSIKRIDCPVILFEGRHDLNVNAVLAERWFQHLQAPLKKLIWFEDSAHGVFDEEPGKTLVTLQSEVLPLTR
jgi:proline iminopeptidase